MLVFLNSAGSTKYAVNENHGRELLELHTVGRQGRLHRGHGADSARILTGYHVETWQPAKQTYNPADHWTGPVQVLGCTASQRERRRPARAERLPALPGRPSGDRQAAGHAGSAQRFVSDQPSASIVRAVAKAYTDSGTDIKAALRALVRPIRTSPRASTTKVADAVPGRDRHLPGARGQGEEAQGGRRLRLRGQLRAERDGRGAVHVARPQRLPRAGFGVGLRGPDAQLLGDELRHGRRLVAVEGHDQEGPAQLPARRSGAASTRRSTAVSRTFLGRKRHGRAGQGGRRSWSRCEPTHDDQSRESFGDWRAIPLIATVLNSPEHLRKMTCSCDDFVVSRRRFLAGTTALLGGVAVSGMVGDIFTQTAYGAPGVEHPRGAQPPGRHRRPLADRPARRSPGTPRPGRRSRPDREPAGQGLDVRAASRAQAARWRCGSPASSARCRPSACRCPTAATSRRWRQVEDADPGSSARVGWLNRMIGDLQPEDVPQEGLQLGQQPCCPPLWSGRRQPSRPGS